MVVVYLGIFYSHLVLFKLKTICILPSLFQVVYVLPGSDILDLSFTKCA